MIIQIIQFLKRWQLAIWIVVFSITITAHFTFKAYVKATSNALLLNLSQVEIVSGLAFFAVALIGLKIQRARLSNPSWRTVEANVDLPVAYRLFLYVSTALYAAICVMKALRAPLDAIYFLPKVLVYEILFVGAFTILMFAVNWINKRTSGLASNPILLREDGDTHVKLK